MGYIFEETLGLVQATIQKEKTDFTGCANRFRRVCRKAQALKTTSAVFGFVFLLKKYFLRILSSEEKRLVHTSDFTTPHN